MVRLHPAEGYQRSVDVVAQACVKKRWQRDHTRDDSLFVCCDVLLIPPPLHRYSHHGRAAHLHAQSVVAISRIHAQLEIPFHHV